MIARTFLPSLPLLILLSYGCSSTNSSSRPEGDMVEVTTAKGTRLAGELVCFDDSSLYMISSRARQQYCVQISLRNLERIEVRGYVNRDWVGAVIGLELIPAIVLGMTASSAGGEGGAIFAVGLGVSALTFALFEASTPPPPHEEGAISKAQALDLSKYARFPQGLTQEQFSTFLALHQWSAPKRLE